MAKRAFSASSFEHSGLIRHSCFVIPSFSTVDLAFSFAAQ